MAKSEKPSSATCFSGIFRRLLCTGNVPTHPSDDLYTQQKKPQNVNHSEEAAKPSDQLASKPSIVARLMGLETLPNAKLLPKETTLGLFLRSRSANSLDYLPPLDLTRKVQHRRVKTSVSFHEVRDTVNQDGHEHSFVVCLEKVDEENEKRLRTRKAEARRRLHVKQKVAQESKGETMDVNNSFSRKVKESKRVYTARSSLSVWHLDAGYSPQNLTAKSKSECRRTRRGLKERRPRKPVDSREESVQLGFNKLRKNRFVGSDKLHPLCHSNVTTPVSVSEISRPTCLDKSAKKLKKLEGSVAKNKEQSAVSSSDYGKQVKTFETGNCSKMLSYISRLSEEDVKGTHWVVQGGLTFDDLEVICVHFGQHILESLLNQVVEELQMRKY